MVNFQALKDPVNWLFLNVSPETVVHAQTFGPFFNDLIESCRFPAHRVVIEVVEQPIEDNERLLGTIEFYKKMGCLIAIDDFGAGHSNFDRIWTLKPDIVKLDRSFLVRASRQKTIRELLPGIVSLLHQAGSLVLIEGIETHEQALIAIESDVDFVQGFFFAKPFTSLSSPPSPFNEFDRLLDHFKDGASAEDESFRSKVARHGALFEQAVADLASGAALEKAARGLVRSPAVVRCYQIGTDGIQVGRSIVSPGMETHKSKPFRPLDDARSADWFRRHYLKRAILHPGQLQISRPYLSITGAHMCITLSMMFSGPEQQSVLCCDLIS